MKNIKILTILILALISFNSCNDKDDFIFIASEAQDLAFNTTFLDEYMLNPAVSSNIAERFTWNDADFDVATEVTYKLQYSLSPDFSVFDEDLNTLGSTNGNELPVTIGQMLVIAEEAGLDNDPNTTDIPNTGQIYFRLKAFVGLDGLESFSAIQSLTVVLQEIVTGGSGIELATWGVVGSGYNNWGAFADAPFYTTSTDGIIVSYVNLLDGEIKFRENNEWVNDFGDDGADGTLDAGGANIAVTAGDYKITLDLNANTYTIEAFSWGVVGSGFNDWGATPDAKFLYDYTTDTFKVGVRLIDGEIKFRMNNEWVVDLGDNGADGTLDAGGENIAVTEGHYVIIMNFNDNTYTIEAGDLWGVVGSGYNDWGATPDFTFTEVNPGIWIAENVTMIDGEIKFRINNEWNVDFGDNGADGTLEAGGENIAVTAGKYIITLDLSDESAPTYSLGMR